MNTVDGFKRIASDVVNLFELQLQLLSLDGKVAVSRALSAVVAFGVALVITLAAVTSLLIAGGWALYETFHIPLSICLLLSGGLGLLIAVVLCAIGYQFAKQASTSLAETRTEFATNLRWIKSMLTSNVEPIPVKNQPNTSNNHFPRSRNDGNGKSKVAPLRS